MFVTVSREKGEKWAALNFFSNTIVEISLQNDVFFVKKYIYFKGGGREIGSISILWYRNTI